MLNGYHQVVGHSKVENVTSIRYTEHSITYIDVLDSINYFHEVDC
ncbi:MAG: hypothetical protein JWR76_370 [Mucilaginibacter sp.]|nr:hypothetical protein [Mucilaginibacter sp.]